MDMAMVKFKCLHILIGLTSIKGSVFVMYIIMFINFVKIAL